VDYDDLAAEYAAHRRHDEAVLEALCTGGRVGPASRVLEVGCGTGSYVIALHEATGASCVGIDPSAQMLALAGSRSETIEFIRGRAEALPFTEDDFDLVFSVDVIHHVTDVAGSLTEAFRVLSGKGRVCVGTDDDETIRGRLLSHYFPETVEVERARYPAIADLHSAMTGAGFSTLREQRTAATYRVLNSRSYRDRAFSSLYFISDGDFREGVERIERDLKGGPIEGVARQFLLWGTKP
jgi:ubiquinone/menaquinone biosynthesis C-methylase UbiE